MKFSEKVLLNFFKTKDYNKNYDDNCIKKLNDQIKKFKVVFDIGAYHGKFVDEILQYNSNIIFHIFEPSSEAYTFLKSKYNNKKEVTINNYAISDLLGHGILQLNNFKETNSLLESVSVDKNIDILTKNESSESVEIISLDYYSLQNNINHIDFIKIDTQGNSYNVIKGMEQLLKSKRVDYLYVEAEFIEIYKGEKLFSEIEILMRSFEYHIVNLYNLNYINNDRLAWCDILFKANN